MASKRTKGSTRKAGGRPKQREADRRKYRLALSLTAAEFKDLEAAAAADQRDLAVYARMLLMAALPKR